MYKTAASELKSSMGRPSTTLKDVELEKIKAELEKHRTRHETIRWCVLGGLVTICVGIIAWAAVQMTNKPAWLVFALALLGVSVPPGIVVLRIRARMIRAVGQLKDTMSKPNVEPLRDPDHDA